MEGGDSELLLSVIVLRCWMELMWTGMLAFRTLFNGLFKGEGGVLIESYRNAVLNVITVVMETRVIFCKAGLF